jgi:tetratricopeptide (TPR) repeat protein
LYQQECIGKKLLLEEKKNNLFLGNTSEKNLDSIIKKSKQFIIINSIKQPSSILQKIGDIIAESGYKYSENNYSYGKALTEKEFECDQYCITYLSIARELNLPIYAILMPEHMILVWEDSKSCIYWEATKNIELSESQIAINFSKKHQSIKNNSIFYRVGVNLESVLIDSYIGEFYLINKDYAHAKQYLEKANLKLSNVNMIKNNLGVIYQNTNNSIIAKKLFLECIASDSTNYKAYNNLGLYNYKKENYDSSIYYYYKAIYFNSQYPDAYNNLGLAYGHTGDFENAIKNFDKAISLNNNDSEYYMNKGVCNIYMKNFIEAEICLTKGISIDPKNVNLIINMAIAKVNLGKKEEACQYLKMGKDMGSSIAENYYGKICK